VTSSQGLAQRQLSWEASDLGASDLGASDLGASDRQMRQILERQILERQILERQIVRCLEGGGLLHLVVVWQVKSPGG